MNKLCLIKKTICILLALTTTHISHSMRRVTTHINRIYRPSYRPNPVSLVNNIMISRFSSRVIPRSRNRIILGANISAAAVASAYCAFKLKENQDKKIQEIENARKKRFASYFCTSNNFPGLLKESLLHVTKDSPQLTSYGQCYRNLSYDAFENQDTKSEIIGAHFMWAAQHVYKYEKNGYIEFRLNPTITYGIRCTKDKQTGIKKCFEVFGEPVGDTIATGPVSYDWTEKDADPRLCDGLELLHKAQQDCFEQTHSKSS